VEEEGEFELEEKRKGSIRMKWWSRVEWRGKAKAEQGC